MNREPKPIKASKIAYDSVSYSTLIIIEIEKADGYRIRLSAFRPYRDNYGDQFFLFQPL